eukprot:752636-Hanusia_phi.AAC.2
MQRGMVARKHTKDMLDKIHQDSKEFFRTHGKSEDHIREQLKNFSSDRQCPFCYASLVLMKLLTCSYKDDTLDQRIACRIKRIIEYDDSDDD